MAKRERPSHIPLSVQVAVAERQLGNTREKMEYVLFCSGTKRMSLANRLSIALGILFGAQTVNLDHTWALIDRRYNQRIKRVADRYTPNANDPAYLEWRPKARDATRSHDIKTFVRGDNGQLSDIGLRNKQRRMDRNRGITKSKRPRKAIKSRGFQKTPTKHKWASRPFGRKGS